MDKQNLMADVNDMFVSIQGESSFSGFICTFIRFQGCPKPWCIYCDSKSAQTNGSHHKKHTPSSIIEYIKEQGVSLVEFTGGEPLLQEEVLLECVSQLLKEDTHYTILVETSGRLPIDRLMGSDPRVRVIMDVKLPSSEIADLDTAIHNMHLLNPWDETKFVCNNTQDLECVEELISDHNPPNPIVSPWGMGSSSPFNLSWLATEIVSKKIPVRLGIQLHKLACVS